MKKPSWGIVVALVVLVGILGILVYTVFTSEATNQDTTKETKVTTPSPVSKESTGTPQTKKGGRRDEPKTHDKMTWAGLIIRVILYVAVLIMMIKLWGAFGLSTYWNRYWANSSLLPIIVCIGLVHLAIYRLAPEFWWNHVCNWWSLVLQIAIGIAVSVRPENKKKPGKHTVSTVTTIILCMTLLVHIGGWGPQGTLNTWWRERGEPPAGKANFTIPNGTPDCFKEQLGPDKDAAYVAFPGQMDLMAVFCRESRFYHLDADGKARTNVNENGTVDTGIAQINSAHDAELKRLGLDKSKLEDNLKYAGILYKKNGLQDWTPKIGEKLVFEVEVSDEWSNTFKMPHIDPAKRPFNYGVKWSTGTLIMAMDDESRIVTVGNGEDLGYPKNYKLKSGKAGEKILVTITYQY